MPQERLPMRKIREVLRLSANGLSKRKIAASLGLSATAVGDCIRRARLAGVAWPPAAELSDAALEQLLYWSVAAAEKRRPQPESAIIHRELKRAGVTLQLLWKSIARRIPMLTATAKAVAVEPYLGAIHLHPDAQSLAVSQRVLLARWLGVADFGVAQLRHIGDVPLCASLATRFCCRQSFDSLTE